MSTANMQVPLYLHYWRGRLRDVHHLGAAALPRTYNFGFFRDTFKKSA